jgi:glycogen synthase
METDTRWDASARQYVELYLSALRATASPS